MNVFDLDEKLVARYQDFTRSFTSIRAQDLKAKIDRIYASNAFWPEPLIGLNPNFRPAQETLEALAANGFIDAGLPQVFAAGQPRKPIRLHRHQEQALSKAQQGKNYIVTTGTGSGKSLCFFVPIIDRILKARRAGEPQRTRAVIIYPMNALANSQREELEKFIGGCGLPDELRPTFRRYTGQEQDSERRAAAAEKPDIILTNFMMLELLMTRQDHLDRAVIENMRGLEFLVLDELHTYRGRQGADVAMLVRRVRERVGSPEMLCVGTSATMASGDEDAGRLAVAEVGTRLFGSAVLPDDVITETLQRRTIKPTNEAEYLHALRRAIVEPSQNTGPADFETDPLAIWVEEQVGLHLGETVRRRPPMTLTQAARDLGAHSGLDEKTCREALMRQLVIMSDNRNAPDPAFMAFKLHRFIAGAGHAHSTLEAVDKRTVSLAGEKFDRDTPDARLYPVFFCRECGQEVHSVSIDSEGQVLPRSIDATPRDEPDLDGNWTGFLVPDAAGDLAFAGNVEDYPDAWLEEGSSGPRLRNSHRGKHEGRLMHLARDGREKGEGIGLRSWFFPGKFRFCPQCRYEPAPRPETSTSSRGFRPRAEALPRR
ncbi:DEAD/DEAH box helicase [Sphingomonas daechungensis]|uniref:DEAD/DEAH box helicase n=1 Tax=Sphingomonas daechungensis TaxID=1176646 RepID=UPI001CB93B5D|nr:DEAD/DEAH box helicase [Sphingomonas daechungensis]